MLYPQEVKQLSNQTQPIMVNGEEVYSTTVNMMASSADQHSTSLSSRFSTISTVYYVLSSPETFLFQ
jgi:hypothetical protein